MVVWKPNILFQISYLPTSPCQCCILRREIYNSLVYLEKQKRSRENSTQPKEELVVSPFMSLFVRIHSASLPSLHSLHFLVFLFLSRLFSLPCLSPSFILFLSPHSPFWKSFIAFWVIFSFSETLLGTFSLKILSRFCFVWKKQSYLVDKSKIFPFLKGNMFDLNARI